MLFMLVVSYASAVTIAFIWLLLNRSTADLSLPDIDPPKNKDGKIAYRLVPEEAELPAGNILRLGQTARYGNVEVTPLKVTRGPLEFVHYKDAKRTLPSSAPVLKLWLKFSNVSKDQAFAPIDKKLMYTQLPDRKNPGSLRSNNFLCRVEEKTRTGERVLVYPLSITSEFDVKGQQLEVDLAPREIQPGEEMTTFIPSDSENLSQLEGDLVWRVHIRKGHNPKSGRGVTTIVEVMFSSDDVQEESAGKITSRNEAMQTVVQR